MYEMWIDKNEPHVRLIVRQGSSLPADLGARNWMLMGPIAPEPEAKREVDAKGFHFFESDADIPDSQTLKNAGASDA